MSESADSGGPTAENDHPHDWRRDRTVVAAVLGAFGAARLLTSTPLSVAVVVCAIGLTTLRPRVVGVGLLLLIGWHAGFQLDRLVPAPTGPLAAAEVELVSDPVDRNGYTRVEVELDGRRVLLTTRSTQARELRRASLGDRFAVSGSVRGSTPESDWRIGRRLVGTISASELRSIGRADGPTRLANELRETLRRGTRSLSDDQRVLFTGLVFGDDRGQGVLVADNFRASGLGHLLAVSGQNVVFVLLLVAPLIARIPWQPARVGVSLFVLVAFGFLTRFEPSVSRAIVMAGLAVLAQAMGRAGSAPLVLPPAVVGLLLFDPLLAWSLAFQLSVAATTGLVVLTPRLVGHVPGPRLLAMAVSATVSAQLAVSPLLLVHFDTISAVAVPANLLAGPAAAAVMMWGLVAGLVAGLVPPELAAVLHVPTELLLWWIDRVAAFFARLPAGHIGTLHTSLFALAVAAAVRTASSPTQGSVVARRAALVLLGVLAVTLVHPRSLPAGEHRLADGVTVVRSPTGRDTLVIDGAARQDDTVRAVRSARLGRIDALVAIDGSRATGALVFLIQQRFDVGETWAPEGHEVPGARTLGDIG